MKSLDFGFATDLSLIYSNRNDKNTQEVHEEVTLIHGFCMCELVYSEK